MLSLMGAMLAMLLTLSLDPFRFAPSGFGTDGIAYLAHAHQLLQDGAFNMGPNSINSIIVHGFLPAGTPNFFTPPVYIAFLAAGLWLWNSWQIALVENFFVLFGTIFFALRLTAFQNLSPFLRGALVVAIALDPAYLLYNGGVQLDTLSAFLACAFSWLWLSALRAAPGSIFRFIAAGLAGAAAVLTRGNILPFIGILVVLSLLSNVRRLDRRQFAGILAGGLVGLVLLAGWSWRTERITGVWTPTGSGNAGFMMSLAYAAGGTRFAPVTVGDGWAIAAYIRKHQALGDPPLHIEAALDGQIRDQVMSYLVQHKAWAAKRFGYNFMRLFLASMYDEPKLIDQQVAGKTTLGGAIYDLAYIYTFGARGLIFIAFLAFPLLMVRRSVAVEFGWLWVATLFFVLLTAFVTPGGDRYRVPVEPFCAIFVALLVTYYFEKRSDLILLFRNSTAKDLADA